MTYDTDSWSIIKLSETDYRVFAGFRGGYISSDSWRVNSGCASASISKWGWIVYGDSGSCYSVGCERYDKHSAYSSNILEALCIKNNAKVLTQDEAFDFLNELVLKSGNGG